MSDFTNKLPARFRTWTDFYRRVLRSVDCDINAPRFHYDDHESGDLYVVQADFLKARVFEEMQNDLSIDIMLLKQMRYELDAFGPLSGTNATQIADTFHKLINLVQLSPLNQ